MDAKDDYEAIAQEVSGLGGKGSLDPGAPGGGRESQRAAGGSRAEHSPRPSRGLASLGRGIRRDASRRNSRP